MARTLAEAQASLTAAYQARDDALAGKTVRVDTSAGSRSVTMEDMTVINDTIKILKREVETLTASAQGFTGDPNVRLATWS